MADPTERQLLPWAIGAVVAIVGSLWAALRAAVGKNEARLETELEHTREDLARARAETVEVRTSLGAKLDAERAAAKAELDAERAAHERTIRMSARALISARPDPHQPQAFEDEAPTGVHNLLDIMTPKHHPADPLLSRYVAGSDPPQPPRPRMPPIRRPPR